MRPIARGRPRKRVRSPRPATPARTWVSLACLLATVVWPGPTGSPIAAQETGRDRWSPRLPHPCKGHGPVLAPVKTLADNRGFDVTHYDLAITSISIPDSTLSGTVTVTGLALTDGLAEMVLDLHDVFTIESVGSPSHGVESFLHVENRLAIVLAQPVAASGYFEVAVSYSGRPPAFNDSGLTDPFVFGEHGSVEDGTLGPSLHTMSVTDRAGAWWPCKDELTDKAKIDIAVTVPEPLVVASNGSLTAIDEMGDGRRTFRWSENHLIPTYLVSLAISDFAQFTDFVTIAADGDSVTIPIPYYVYPEDLEDARADFARMPEAIALYSEIFGPYPFRDEKYGTAMIDWGGGAMEHQTCTSLGFPFVTGTGFFEWVFVHELAHQWWGDWVSLADWRDVWLNEGFATYAEALWVEHLQGLDSYREYLAYLDWPQPDPGGEEILLTGTLYDPYPLFGLTPYYKGAWVLHMLRRFVGDDAFFRILRAYGERHGEPNGEPVTTEDFVAICREIHDPNGDGATLEEFFDQWVYHPGRPHYRWAWGTTPSGGGFDVTIWLSQIQRQHDLFKMPIDILIEAEDETVQRHVIWNTMRVQSFTLQTEMRPVDVHLDPEGWILKVVVPPDGLAETATLRVPLPNPGLGASRIRYALPADETPVVLGIYDLLGRRIRTLVDGPRQGREHGVIWDGRNDAGQAVASGVYLVRLKTDRHGSHEMRLVMLR